jgi:hypothetical protein
VLTITVGATSSYDEAKQEFVEEGGVELQLEHSLVSLSKWESLHEKPFLGEKKKTGEEVLSYVECMVLGEIPRGEILHQLSEKNFNEINSYIDKKMTATWFSEIEPRSRNQEIVTAELVYYWMTVFSIPWEAQHWHLNRLFTLIRICNLKQQKPKPMSKSEVARRNRELNAKRRAELGTKG